MKRAVEARDYQDVDRQYRLIENRGVLVLVPYPERLDLFERIRQRMLSEGVTASAMKEAAPITVTTFEKNISEWAEPVPFRSHDGDEESGWYILRAQCHDRYRDDTGLQFSQPSDTGNADFSPIF